MELLISLFLLTTSAVAKDDLLSHKYFRQYKACAVKKNMLYLKKDQKEVVVNKTSVKDLPLIFKTYKITCGEKTQTVYLLSDLIRTHYQNGFVSVQNGKIENIEIVDFREPLKYKAPMAFVKNFFGKSNFAEVDGLTGATLTRNSLFRLSKMALALDAL